jgi:dipeptidyl aminopeptidase/acylaminoacyl peptidase
MQPPLDRDALFTRYLAFSSLLRGGSVQPHWLADGTAFWYVDTSGEERQIWRVDAQGHRTPFFDLPRLRTALRDYFGYEVAAAGVPFSDFELTEDETAATFCLDGRELQLDLETYALSEAVFPPWETERARATPRFLRHGFQEGEKDIWEITSPDGRWITGENGPNLTLRSTADGRVEPLTFDGTPDTPWDLLSVQWSPDGSQLAATRINYKGVRRLPVVHWLKQHEDIEWHYFPRTGDAMPQLSISMFDVQSRRQTHIDTGPERDQMLFGAGWTPDNSAYRVLKLGRTMKPVTLLEVDRQTGTTRVLLYEDIKTYLPQSNLDEPVQDLLTPLSDGRFIWLSAHTGWSHLYLYNADGNLQCALTSGEFPVLRTAAVDEAGGWVYFYACAEERLYDQNLYRVPLNGGPMQRLTDGIGVHRVETSPSQQVFIDTCSSPRTPPIVELRTASGELIEVLSRTNTAALEATGWRPPEEFVAPAADGETPLYGVMFLPNDFDPNRRYPVIEYIYGGPQVIATPHTFAAGRAGGQTGALLGGTFQRALAQLGFIVVTLDARGTIGRSQAFHDISYQHFGTTVIPDHVAAIRHIAAERPYMDLSRVAITGLSWGGYNTLRAMLTAPDFYHVGIATNPAVDLEDHYGEWAEGVMGTLEENREGYREASNIHVAGNLKGKLLLIHSTADTNATFSTTMKMIDALIDAGKPYDLMVLPEQTHHPLGTRQAYWVDTMKRYLVEHLNPYQGE